MPQRDPGVYLEDIERYASAAVCFISNYSLEQYLADEKTRVVERVLEIATLLVPGMPVRVRSTRARSWFVGNVGEP